MWSLGASGFLIPSHHNSEEIVPLSTMTHSKDLITPELSNKVKEEATDTSCPNPSAVAMKALKQDEEAVGPMDDELSDEEVIYNQLGIPENYLMYYGRRK